MEIKKSLEKVLVTGGAGFIGSHIVDELIENGYDVTIVDDLSSGKLENINKKADFYICDVSSKTILQDVFEETSPDCVIHHAAQATVVKSMNNPVFDAQINIIGTLNLLELSKEFKVEKFIYAGSGGTAYGNPSYLPCDENHPVNPISPYGISKHTVEHYLNFYHNEYGLDYVSFRYPNIYGERQDPSTEAGVISIFAKQMLQNKEVIIYGNGLQSRDFVYVKDIAYANLLALEKDNIPSGIYNLGWGEGTTIDMVYETLRVITRYKKNPINKPERSGEVYRTFLNADKFKKYTWWKPEVSLSMGCMYVVDWMKRNL
jgi:UDP-glucose 4-epimerase